MKPILCNYYITYRCNASCQFCDIWQDAKYKIKDCLLEATEANLHDLKKFGVKFIDFTGGEPLLHKDLPQMLEIAKELKFYTSVTTNCLCYPKVANKIKGKVDLLHFSIDSLNEYENNTLRGSTVFDRIKESIQLAHQLDEKPDLLFTVTHHNYKAIRNLTEFAAQHKLMLIVNPVFNYTNQMTLSQEILNYIELVRIKPYVYMNHALHRLIRQGGNNRTNPRCRAISSTIVISPDNNLLLPCFHHAQFKIPINSNLLNILKSPFYNKIKAMQGRFSFCQHCTINCYFDPSFLYKLDQYFLLSLASKAKYGFDKYVRRYCGR